MNSIVAEIHSELANSADSFNLMCSYSRLRWPRYQWRTSLWVVVSFGRLLFERSRFLGSNNVFNHFRIWQQVCSAAFSARNHPAEGRF